jgi:ankyrin repeat protein
MVLDDRTTMELMRAIAAGDGPVVSLMLGTAPALATRSLEVGASRQVSTDFFLTSIGHYVYAGDSPLHVAAAGYRLATARDLVTAGADIAARNRRGAQPLHYAADGSPGSAHWDPRAQAAMIALLLEAGADPNACDRSGVAPLHRAVRTRCADAVRALIDAGADPDRRNRNGSTPMMLATRPTGRGGSGSPDAKAQQQEILRLLQPQTT